MNYFALRHLGPGGALALIRGFRRWILPLAVLAAGSVLSAMGSMWLLRLSETDAAGNFNRLVEREAEEVRARFLRPVYGLNGARGVYATHPSVRRSQFRAYVASRNLPTEFPGARGFGFIERVDHAALPAFMAAERADGAPEFMIRQLGSYDGPDRFIIKFIEPAANNLGAMGVDLASEAVRRQAALQAIETGEATISGIISLVVKCSNSVNDARQCVPR
jgi:CHASE1-domain containing sensor protein